MFHKFLTFAAVLFSAFALYAQRPVVSAVTDIEDDPANGLEMCRSLFNEYFLSELTTHSKIHMLDTATVQKSVAKLKLSRGHDLSQKEVSSLCSQLKTDALCLVKMVRNAKKEIVVTVKIIDKSGKTSESASATMKGIGDTDAASHSLGRRCAVILRKLRGIEEPEKPKEAPAEPVSGTAAKK